MSDRAARLLGVGLALLWLVGLAVADLLAPDDLSLTVLLAVAPLIASTVLPGLGTAAVGLAAVVLAVASGWWNDSWSVAQQTVRVVDVVIVSTVAVVVAVVRVRREHRYERVAAIAEVAQRTVLPTLPPVAGHVGLGARYVSAAEDAVVGGDLYDCYHSDSRVRVLVGDVRGKGLGAVEQAARVIRAFRQAAATQLDLPAVAADMSAYLRPFFDDEEFVTALLVDASAPHRLSVVSCGHPPPLRVCRDGRSDVPELPANLPLGLGSAYVAAELPWSPGDRLLLYTDGLSEARDRRGTFLSVQPLAPVLAGRPLHAALDGLIAAVQEHVPGARLGDDLAVLLLENLDAATYSSASGSAEAASGVSSRGPSAEPAVVWGEGRSSPRSAGASGMFSLMGTSRVVGACDARLPT